MPRPSRHRPVRKLIGWAVLILACCLAVDVSARPGRVQTRDGRSYEGQIRLDTNILVIANAERDFLVEIQFTNLLEVMFREEAGDTERLGIGSRLEPGALPQPWLSEAIQSSRSFHGHSWANDLFRLWSSGTNILGESDSFHFVYKRVKGNSEIVARLVGFPQAGPGSKAGLMMRDSLKPESGNVLLALLGARGGVFQSRGGNGQNTTLELQRDMFAPFWIKLKREGDSFAAYKSRTGNHWTLIRKINIAMNEEICVGLAVAGGHEQSWGGRSSIALTEAVLDNVREASSLPRTSFVPQVKLVSGSEVRGRLESGDPASLQFSGVLPPSPLPTAQVASIQFSWVPFRLSGWGAELRPGALLTDGEFVDGEFKRIENGRLLLSSVLFGLRSFDINTDLIAVNLRPPTRPPHRYEVTTVNGSRWLGSELKVQPNEVVVWDGSLGGCRIPIYELKEVRRSEQGAQVFEASGSR